MPSRTQGELLRLEMQLATLAQGVGWGTGGKATGGGTVWEGQQGSTSSLGGCGGNFGDRIQHGWETKGSQGLVRDSVCGCCFWEAEEEKGRSQALSQPRDLSPIPISDFCPSIFVGTSLAPAMIMELVVSS